jgi:hypothetical protein
MKILLINANPVVSRLLDLCTRDENLHLDEVSSTKNIVGYDVLFVDDASYDAGVTQAVLLADVGKKVFITSKDEEVEGFDITVKKPFLPSDIISLLQSLKNTEPSVEKENILLSAFEEEKEEESEVKSDETVLDTNEIAKIKELLEMDDEVIEDIPLDEDALEARKIEAIKEQLIANGLEIVEEKEIFEEFSNDGEEEGSKDVIFFSSDEDVVNIEDEMKNEKKKKKKDSQKKAKKAKNKNKKIKKKKKKTIFTEDDLEKIEDAIEVAIATLKRKQMKKLLKGEEITVNVKLEDF